MRAHWLLAILPACSLLTNLDDLAGDGGTQPGPGCPTQDATFCDDFSEQPIDASFLPPWTARNGAGQVYRTSCDGAPCLAISTSGPQMANLEKDFGPMATKVHYAFDLEVTQYPTDGAANVMNVEATVNMAAIEIVKVFLEFQASAARLTEQSGLPDGAQSASIILPFTPPAVGTWTHFDVMMDISSGTMTLDMNHAGMPTTRGIPAGAGPSPIIVKAGVGFETAPTDHFAMNVTNTVVWLQ